MMILSKALEDSIRFETNYQNLQKTLIEINEPRFRALGKEQSRIFVKGAIDLGDQLNFTRVGSISYLLFLMNWLGSSFYTDPRYRSIEHALRSRGTESARIEATRTAFLEFADRQIGEELEVLVQRLQSLEQFDPELEDKNCKPSAFHKLLCEAWNLLAEPSSYSIRFIETRAQEMTMRLNADTDYGRKLCLLLTVLLGANADLDPLYPWIRDTAAAADAAKKPVDKALVEYSKKRLAAILRSAP